MNKPVFYYAQLDVRTLRRRESRTVKPYSDSLPIFSGIDETRPDGCVPVNIAGGMCSVITETMVDLTLTHLTIPLDEPG